MVQFFHTLSYVILPLMPAVVLHEYAHGWVAEVMTGTILSRLVL